MPDDQTIDTTGQQQADQQAKDPQNHTDRPKNTKDSASGGPGGDGKDGKDGGPETFTREYVQQLRDESAGYRTRAKDRDDLAKRLHAAVVGATGRLADPTDLPFDEAHLADEAKLTAAIDDLIGRKPHLASRRPAGDVGQGATETGETVDLAGLLRGLAS